MSKGNANHFLFLSPLLTIKNEHLTKRDVDNIKISLSHKMGATALVLAAVLFLLNIFMFFSMGIETNWNQINVYGVTSFLAQIISIVGTLAVATLEILSLKIQKTNIKNKLTHIAGVLMYIVLALDLFLSLYADAAKGFLSASPTISASLTLISLLVIIQPVYWSEAITLDGAVSIGLAVLSIYATNKYNIQGLMYYLFIALVFPIGSYLIVSILFYAETQKYCEELRNEALHNTATYDELTLCKNRHALKETLEENAKIWENNKDIKLLVMLFDIDDFNLYNDQYSHIGGDYCLKSIADCVRKTFPSPTLDFYRYGGEEFLLFLEVTNKTQAEIIMEKVRNSIKGLGIIAAKGAPSEYVTISIGGTYLRTCDINDFNDIIKIVDGYLYEAKRNGKNISVLDGRIITPR